MFFLISSASSNLCEVIFDSLIGTTSVVAGSSGALFAFLAYILFGNPLAEVVTTRALIVSAVVMAPVIVVISPPETALIAHLSGFILGIIAGRLGFLTNGLPRNMFTKTEQSVQ
jgi:membrane associated rhomboid family serine protease